MEKKLIITINREYGAGGRSVARKLSEHFGIPFYDKDFVKKAAEESGLDEETVAKDGEMMTRTGKWFHGAQDELFRAQRRAVLYLAKEPCIIIGRCSNWILKQANVEAFDIFLYSDLVHKSYRAIELGEYGDIQPEKFVEKQQKLREEYYRTYTGHEMGDYRLYDICLNTGTLGMEESANVLIGMIRKWAGSESSQE